MIWFVDPEDYSRAIELRSVVSIEILERRLCFYTEQRTFIWNYDRLATVERVYNDIIKLLQQDRYRVHET
jgi:hypothetical protein